MKTHDFLKAACAAALLTAIAIPHADAQSRGFQPREERATAATEVERMFPQAERAEPDLAVPPRMSRLLRAFESVGTGEGEQHLVIEEAQKLIDDRAATPFVRSFAAYRMAEAYEELDDMDRAIDAMQKTIEYDGLTTDQHYLVMLRLGQTLAFEGREEEGIATILRFFEETKSEQADHLALLGSVYYQTERYDGAIEYMTRAIAASDTPQPNWQQVLMASYAETGRDAEAIAAATEVVRNAPDDKRAVFNLATLHMQAEQSAEAAQVLADARARGLITDAQDYDRAARLYLNMEREADAAAILQEGIAAGVVEPTHQNYNLLAQSYYFSGQHPEAIRAWTEAAKTAPDGETALNLARAHYEEGNWQQARTFANEALQKGLANDSAARAIINNADIELRR